MIIIKHAPKIFRHTYSNCQQFCLIYSFYNAKNALFKKNLKRLPFSHSQLIQNEDDELLIPHLHT